MAPPKHRGEASMVPDVEFESYHGKPILKRADLEDAGRPALPLPRRAGGASSLLAEGAALTGKPDLSGSRGSPRPPVRLPAPSR